jgi:hypothetical protein
MPKAYSVPKPAKYALFICLVVVVLFNVLMMLAIDDSPLLPIHSGLNPDDIKRAKQILQMTPEERSDTKTILLNEKDVNIAVSYLLDHFVENTVSIELAERQVSVQIAVFVPKPAIWGRYLDFSFKLIQNGDGAITIKSFKIGEISVPDRAANYLLPLMLRQPPLNKYWRVWKHYFREIRFTAEGIHLTYLGALMDAAKDLVIQKHREYPNLHLYQQQINDIVEKHDASWRLSLMDLLQPLFLSAYQRSTDDTAIRENRAVIIAVGSYIYKYELRRYLPIGLMYSKDYQVFAYKRADIPQHFIASALLAAANAHLLSERLGVDKELGDAENGSGFSFIDIMADRAGTRFGRLAVSSEKNAREFQRVLATATDYATIIPDLQGLPENMNQATFKSLFGNTDSKRYRNMIKEIDRRIDALPLYRQD